MATRTCPGVSTLITSHSSSYSPGSALNRDASTPPGRGGSDEAEEDEARR